MKEPDHRYIGLALSPRESRKLALGRGTYVDDLAVPGMQHAAFVRNPTPGSPRSTPTPHGGRRAS